MVRLGLFWTLLYDHHASLHEFLAFLVAGPILAALNIAGLIVSSSVLAVGHGLFAAGLQLPLKAGLGLLATGLRLHAARFGCTQWGCGCTQQVSAARGGSVAARNGTLTARGGAAAALGGTDAARCRAAVARVGTGEGCMMGEGGEEIPPLTSSSPASAACPFLHFSASSLSSRCPRAPR